jgi:hypothetical protein
MRFRHLTHFSRLNHFVLDRKAASSLSRHLEGARPQDFCTLMYNIPLYIEQTNHVSQGLNKEGEDQSCFALGDCEKAVMIHITGSYLSFQ